MFNVDFNLLIQLLLPSFLRKNRMIAVLNCLIAPVNALYDDFTSYRLRTLKRLEYTGQVIYLEKLLNDTFNLMDIYNSQIYIEDIADIEYDYLFNHSEALSPMILYNSVGETNPITKFINNEIELQTPIHFIVRVPILLFNSLGTSSISEMRALINLYKIAGKQFLILSI